MTMVQQGFPFTVEPVVPQRVQMWASSAGQVSTQEGFNLISSVFNALWWEDAAYQSYQIALSLLGSSTHVSSVIFYLDMIVNEAGNVVEYWAYVVERMPQVVGPAGQWEQDAVQHIETGKFLQQVAASQVVLWCQQYQLALPEYTQAFLTEVQGR